MVRSTLRSLAELILKNVEIVEADLETRDASGPDVNEPFVPGADIAFGNPEVSKAIYLVTCAAQQLLQTIRPPQACLMQEVSLVKLFTSRLRTSVFPNAFKSF